MVWFLALFRRCEPPAVDGEELRELKRGGVLDVEVVVAIGSDAGDPSS